MTHVDVGRVVRGRADRAEVSPWFRALFRLQPETDLILQAPIGFRLHVLAAWALFAFWPFSRLG